jgi:hypothetical protein
MRSPLTAARLAFSVLAMACGPLLPGGHLTAAPAPPSASGYYVGTIGKSLHVQMDLAVDGMDVSGTYYYEHIGEPLALRGLVDAHHTFQLEEADADNRKTGMLSGKLAADLSTFEGEWSSADGKRTLPFRLACVARWAMLRESPEITATYPVFISQSPAIQKAGRRVQRIHP